ncbi:hypothetical protein H0H93_003153 [Arthromyces matolae]|nr:hypothetical protein H0H93_003153 [Arthromyces matolae]
MSILPRSLSTGQGTRFVLAATEHLHRRIASLSTRIRLLEDALMSLQASHPLLHPDLVGGGNDEDAGLMDEDTNGDKGEKERGGSGDVIGAFGTLSISDHGISRFFGPTGGVESKLSPSPRPSSPLSTSSVSSPSNFPNTSSPSIKSAEPLALFSSSFPFTPLGSPEGVQDLVASHLPSRLTAEMLIQTYIQQCSWLFHGVTKAQLEEMVEEIYSRIECGQQGTDTRKVVISETAEEQKNTEGDYSGPHDLALLFIIFAVGALVQPSRSTNVIDAPTSLSPPHGQSEANAPPSPVTTASSSHIPSTLSSNALGEHYYQVSRAALALQPVLEKPSLVTIQTLHLMSIYNAMSGSDLKSETSMEVTWSLITLAAHLSMTIGLHRDSVRWGLTPKMVQRRQILFWDLFVADVWQSLNTGRPPSFSLAYIDCSFPDARDNVSGEGPEAGFGGAFSTWQCRFAAECVAEVTARTLTPETPTYATIMELDKKVREFPLPPGMGDGAMGKKQAKESTGNTEGEEDLAWSFQKCVLDHIRETGGLLIYPSQHASHTVLDLLFCLVLMYIHRSFFAQAIIEHPANPLKSPYAPSFLAAYRAASTILKSVREQFSIWPNSSARFWTMWTFAFSAAIVFGTVVTRGPRSPLAQSAMHELEQAYVLFSRASVYSIRATKALPILAKLTEKARNALATAQKDHVSLSDAAGGLLWNMEPEQEEEDELSIFAGHTRFVSARKSDRKSAHRPQSEQQQHSNVEWTQPAAYMDVSSGSSPLPPQPPVSLHYPYAVSEETTRNLDVPPSPAVPSVWNHATAVGPSHQYRPLHQPEIDPTSQQHPIAQPPRIIPSQFYSSPSAHHPQYSQHPHQQAPYHTQPHPLQPQQAYVQQVHPNLQRIPEYHPQTYPQPSQPQQYSHQSTHALHPGNTQLADLGLAARDSRLDERWSSFMHESGILEDNNYQRH